MIKGTKITDLNDPVSKIPLVGPAYCQRLERLEIKTVRDFLWHLPYDYEDYTNTVSIADLQAGQQVTVKGTVIEAKNIVTKNKKKITQVLLRDKSGQILLIWFNQFFLVSSLKVGLELAVCGKPAFFSGKLALVSPSYEVLYNPKQPSIHTGRLVPKYACTQGLSSKWLRSRINYILKNTDLDSQDTLPNKIKEEERLPRLKQALTEVHFPQSKEQIKKSRYRLSFEEMFWWQLQCQWSRQYGREKNSSVKINSSKHLETIRKVVNELPFKITQAQVRCVKEILNDMNRNIPMNRLLQGDVGSGKTIVAALASLPVVLEGYQVAYLAPTQTLVRQQYEKLKELFAKLGFKVDLVTGEQKEELTGDLLVGTHALLFRPPPNKLALVIIDEQHRFGVNQRTKLLEQKVKPHLLTMSATPIPRTLFLSVFGHLDISTIDQMPKDRIPPKTWVVGESKRNDAYRWVEKRVSQGDQVFIVYPLIQESEKENMAQIKAATQEYAKLKEEVFPKLNLGLIHGKLKQEEKNKVIEDFRQKRLDILAATSVVEVGIDIPQAAVMIIEGAERFGLASLHQLRGRVGRAGQESFCLLFTSQEQENVDRLKLLEKYNSGLDLAEEDLKIRGPGSFFGTSQHGHFLNLKIADLFDQELAAKTKKWAQIYLNNKELINQISAAIKTWEANKIN
ncbi:ATP-dependent DNA helicase RecG [candidate division WWE3 bacterium CG08_land_8_20_14_0_20_43_13]|uniref:Probable DNA 3'-5' helicase RecG n=1 Tax=candidate division WWE3 bacterium CG08_land_8_20_14_0_20_43_13 TaxID=1975087 RepID=A0A2H0X856_UNCKA|nr:MAG: ATP-dependent DNA helicase RecG [candidate division WWE3 bacterium CG08_land_8_20_14_0_20_43_13]